MVITRVGVREGVAVGLKTGVGEAVSVAVLVGVGCFVWVSVMVEVEKGMTAWVWVSDLLTACWITSPGLQPYVSKNIIRNKNQFFNIRGIIPPSHLNLENNLLVQLPSILKHPEF